MKTAGWNSDAFRAYLQSHVAEESDMKAVLMQIKNIVQSETDDEAAALAALANEQPSQQQDGTSSADSTSSGAVRGPGANEQGGIGFSFRSRVALGFIGNGPR